ncbi:hypothetical protein [Streptomyces sp. NPDC059970]|uniref:hypothetical protein n=1 Tax=Streptomyces sp. NPDC059970 TaxID=3347019 RepID=UPI0036C1B518
MSSIKSTQSADPSPVFQPGSISTTHVAGVVAFPTLGTVMAMGGMPVADIYPLLGICGAIGVSAVFAASGGRRLIGNLAALLLRSGQ